MILEEKKKMHYLLAQGGDAYVAKGVLRRDNIIRLNAINDFLNKKNIRLGNFDQERIHRRIYIYIYIYIQYAHAGTMQSLDGI